MFTLWTDPWSCVYFVTTGQHNYEPSPGGHENTGGMLDEGTRCCYRDHSVKSTWMNESRRQTSDTVSMQASGSARYKGAGRILYLPRTCSGEDNTGSIQIIHPEGNVGVVEIWTEVVDEHGYRFPVKDLLHATGGVDFQPYLSRVFALWWLFPVVPDSS